MPVGEVKNKAERGKVWFELSIFYKRYELLATGGVFYEERSAFPWAKRSSFKL